ncbi:MAG: hypothetical protein MUE41_17625, partial [Gemmatimonadaceae bacterium]|nr:hypothetical protein [Gemmatimonadaceae bacterium]
MPHYPLLPYDYCLSVISSCSISSLVRTTFEFASYDAIAKMRVRANVTRGTAGRTLYWYDQAGSSRFESTVPPSQPDTTGQTTAERASFYSADGRLIATDTRRSGSRVFEEYRYDAL